MIDFACPECRRKIKIKADLAGRKGKCPQCGKALTIPAPSAALAEAATLTPRPAPAEDATLPPKQSAAEGPRDTHSDADATDGVRSVPSSELTDFLAPPLGPTRSAGWGLIASSRCSGPAAWASSSRRKTRSLQRLVALKAMLPTLAASASARERFLREARSAAAVKHDHIVAIYQVGEDRGVPYLAMPFLKGEPLDDRLEARKQAAAGRSAAHRPGDGRRAWRRPSSAA